MKKLPIGIQTFSKIRQDNYAYVDKTPFIRKLLDSGEYYFISRPRRFGKSLFVDTLKEAFEANRDLFKGLYLENNWDWGKKHPVIRISFGGGTVGSRQELDMRICGILKTCNEALGMKSLQDNDIPTFFANLIRKSSQAFGQKTVILVDEYDKPILDNITDTNTAVEIREGLKSLYSVIKDNDAHIRFAFLTGVSKFSKVSLFSGLNNLTDITIDEPYSALCGYTQADLETVFAEHLEGLDMDVLRRWYNGYSWAGENVYNPFGMLQVLRSRQIRNYWFETATPSFLIKLLQKRRYDIPRLESLEVGEEVALSFDVEQITPEALLFQTGYLTIDHIETVAAERVYHLKYPNIEVQSSLNSHILNNYLEDPASKTLFQKGIYKALDRGDPELIHTTFKSLFASIPHDWYRKNNMDAYEGYYASVFYSYFASLGLEMKAEDATSKGNIDLMVRQGRNVYLFEFKMADSPAPAALDQIKEKHYHEKYRSPDTDLFLIGIVFSKAERNIIGFSWEKAT